MMWASLRYFLLLHLMLNIYVSSCQLDHFLEIELNTNITCSFIPEFNASISERELGDSLFRSTNQGQVCFFAGN